MIISANFLVGLRSIKLLVLTYTSMIVQCGMELAFVSHNATDWKGAI